MDNELIRKAAEAMHEYCRLTLRNVLPSCDIPFDKLRPKDRRYLSGYAEAALKVFLEHTRSQPREGRGVRCPDCGAAMTPTQGTPCWTCHTCGKTV